MAAAAASPLTRLSVPANNSCLFEATARLCEGITESIPLKIAGRRLRIVCADLAAADADPMTKALMLGHDSIEAYRTWICNEHHWGGEPEVLMLATHFRIEISICSCESLSFLRYSPEGEEPSPKGRVYLLYTGQHYDPIAGSDGTLVFRGDALSAAATAEHEAAALAIARAHNQEAAERALEKRVNRLKCNGCGAILDDAAAFQEHCTVVEHDDDFAYDCEQVEVVISAGEALPDGHVDLNAADVHAFYNASSADALSLSMRCAAAPFAFGGATYGTLEEFWRAMDGETIERRRELLGEAIRAQYASEGAASSGLRQHLLETAPKMIVCVDTDPWLGMQAAGGISTGQNGMGRALMATRDELMAS